MVQASHSVVEPTLAAEPTKNYQVTSLRQLFTSRMMKLLSCAHQEEQKLKSWAGSATPAPTRDATISRRQSSPSITITSSVTSSATLPSRRSRPRDVLGRDSVADDDATCSDASWRQRQTHCVNCEQLFFTSMSALSNSAGRFCSLDCKTSFEYMNQLRKALSEQDFVCTSTSSSSCSWICEGHVSKAVGSEGELSSFERLGEDARDR
jgi:hypothetical protein